MIARWSRSGRPSTTSGTSDRANNEQLTFEPGLGALVPYNALYTGRVFSFDFGHDFAPTLSLNTEVITSDHQRLLKNAGKDVSKQTALRAPEMKELVEQARAQQAAIDQSTHNGRTAQKPQKVQELTRD